MTEASVLVVEKDRQLAVVLEKALEPQGFAVNCVGQAVEALALLDKSLQLIVVGEELSDIDGLGFIVKVRDSNRKIPLVFVCNKWREPEFYRMLRDDLKVNLIVHRPLRAQVFAAQIESLLGSAAGRSLLDLSGGLDGQSQLPQVESAPDSQFAGPEFEKLKQRFLQSIPGRLSKLQTCIQSCSTGVFFPDKLEAAVTIAHNLKGTSLSWGYQALGRSAELMEVQLKTLISASEQSRAAVFQRCLETMEKLSSQAEGMQDLRNGEFDDAASVFDEDGDLSAAKVLLVSAEPPPRINGKTESGLALSFIHASQSEAIQKAAQFALDAALIEIGSDGSSMSLARELRDLKGYENLPLGFISPPQVADARADAAHAGSSLFVPRPLESELMQKVVSQLISMREGGRFRVLVVDDDQDLAGLTSRCLGQFGMITRIVSDPLQVEHVLAEFSPDLVLLDVNMPGLSGFELCRALRSSPRWRDLPILFLTGQTDLLSRLTAYEAGADDYLPKPVINVELLTRVKVRLERARELKERSEKDLLTGLLLRRAFVDQAEALISECQRFNFNFSICLLDVDHFKQVNDRHGHHAGDDVLMALGRLLRRRFRVEDLRGRWGGEEFIIAFKHEEKKLVKLALARIMEELKKQEFQGENGESFHVTFSAGLSSFPDEGSSLHEMVKIADRRLYLAKERGRKQIVIDD